MTKNGTGTLTLSGANSYDGTTTINSGVVAISNATALGTTAGGTTVASGAALELSGSIALGAEALTLSGTGVSSGGALRSVSGTNSLTGAIALGAAATIATDAGTLTLSGAISTAGNTLTFASTGDTTVSGVVDGAGGIAKTGTGTLTLSGANSYSGATTISTGALRAANSTALGTTGIGTTIANGAALELIGGITIGAESTMLAGTGPTGGGALLNVSGNNSFGGALVLTSATTIGSTDGMLTLNGPSLSTGAHALTFDGDGDITLAIAMGGSTGFTKTGLGTLVLGAAMNSTGTVTLASGTLDLGGLSHTIGTLQVTGDSILDFSGTSTLALTSISIASGVKLTVVNWVDLVDFFSAVNSPGATNLGRIEFTGFTTADTKWQTIGGQITPVPEPATYGAWLLGVALGCYGWRRWRGAAGSTEKRE